MRKSYLMTGFSLLALLFFANCTENVATAPDLDLIDTKPHTLEVLVPSEQFVQDVTTWGGYGSASDFGSGVVAKDFNGFSAKTIVRFGSYPESFQLEGTETSLKYLGGRVVLSFDSVQGPYDESIGIEILATQNNWDAKTANWNFAVDTAGNKAAWNQPGAGSSVLVASGDLDSHLAGDSVVTFASISLDVDSASVANWGKVGDQSQGIVVASSDSGTRLNLWNASLVLTAVPLINPDTIVEIPIPVSDLSFIVDPMPVDPTGWLRVGGLPSWRSVITIKLPEQIQGSVEVCGSTECSFDLSKSQLNLAELILTTRETEVGFKPTEPLGVEVRSVLDPQSLPKSPLGEFIGGQQGVTIKPELFSGSGQGEVKFELTELLMKGFDEKSSLFPSQTIALLSSDEGSSLSFASFEGSGNSGPVLRLLLTVPQIGTSP